MSKTSTDVPSKSEDAKSPAKAAAEWKDCTACRLTGAATFTGIGSYAIYEGYNQGAFAKIRPKRAPRSAQMTVALGAVLIAAGLGRLAV